VPARLAARRVRPGGVGPNMANTSFTPVGN
jgi:hypothetical protein